MAEAVDCTPEALKTEAGKARLNKALEAVSKIDQQCWEALRELYKQIGDKRLRTILIGDVDNGDAELQVDNIKALLEAREYVGNELGMTLANRPAQELPQEIEEYLPQYGTTAKQNK